MYITSSQEGHRNNKNVGEWSSHNTEFFIPSKDRWNFYKTDLAEEKDLWDFSYVKVLIF